MMRVWVLAIMLLILVGLTILLIVGLQRVDESSQDSRVAHPVPAAIS
jgi:hypothetical protein